jgi:DNA transformation protein
MADRTFLDDVLGRLAGLEGLRARAMFGGWGLYAGADFFGIVYRARLYFRTSPATRPRYAAQGMGPFRPRAKLTLSDYYEVPPAVYGGDELLAWAEEAVRVTRER